MARSGLKTARKAALSLTPATQPKGIPRDIFIDRILVPKKNLRTAFDTPKDAELVDDVKRRGVLSRLWVRDNSKWRSNGKKKEADYDLIAGERRLRAAKAAGLTVVPCEVFDVDDETAEDMMTIENLQRDDLHALDYADGFARMVRQRGHTVEQVAETVSKGKTFIREHLGFANLPDEARAAFRADEINKSVAVLIATIPGEKERKKFTSQVLRGSLSVREAKQLKEREYMKELKGAPFPLDQQIDPAWPYSCLTCPHYNGNTEETRQGKRPDICLNPPHYQVMVQLWTQQQAQKAADDGNVVLSKTETAQVFAKDYDGKYRKRYGEYKHVELSDKFMDYGKAWQRFSWKEVAERAELQPIISVTPDGNIHKLLLKTEAEAAAKRLGHKLTSSSSTPTARDPKAAADKRKNNAVRRAVAARIVAQVGKLRAPHARLSLSRTVALVEWMIDKMGGASFLVKQLDIAPKKRQYGGLDWEEALSRYARKQGSISLVPFMAQILFVDVIEPWAIADWGSGNPDAESIKLCKLFGVDVRKIQSQELARYNALKAAKKKPAKAKRAGKTNPTAKAKTARA